MAVYTGPDQVVQPGGFVIFDTVVEGCNNRSVRHRNGTGAFLLSGANRCPCNPKYDVKFGANIGVPTGETVGAVSLALGIDGSPDNTTIMTATPAAVEEFFNVGRCVSMTVWNGCCETLAVQNVGATPVAVNAPRISINR